MKRIKKALLFLLVGVFLLSLCGCGGISQAVGNTVSNAINDAINSAVDNVDLNGLLENETLRELLGEGFSVDDLLGEGFSVQDFLGEGFSVGELLGEGASLGNLLEGGIDVESLLGEGVSVGDLLSEGVTEELLEEAGVTEEELEAFYGEQPEETPAPIEETAEPVEEAIEPTAEPTPEPTPEPTADPTPEPTPEPEAKLDENGYYTSKEDVAEYLKTYRKLPPNFMTKNQARDEYDWEGGGLPDNRCIGGDRFGNYEGLLPSGYTYTECDIDTMGKKSRGAKRIIFTITKDEIYIYYTDDHYESFTELYKETK